MEIITKNNTRISRPIQLVDGVPYFSTLVPVRDNKGRVLEHWVVSSGDFASKFSYAGLPGHMPMAEAPFRFELAGTVKPGSLLSAEAYERYALNNEPLPPITELFSQVTEAISAFVSFDGSFANQEDMAAFVACWAVSTYATGVFDTVGYVWPNGERGSGKTQCLKTVMALSFMGDTVTSGSSFASIRDAAGMGATIGLDDCEELRRMDPNKRELLLAGNTKGAGFMLKEPGKRDGQWETRYVDGFAPRAFTSIVLPDEVLASRTIIIPLVRTGDTSKTRRKPTNLRDWKVPPQTLRDGLWLNVCAELKRIEDFKAEVDTSSDLSGRDYDIFQAPLVIARWLDQAHKVEGLFDRMAGVMSAYHQTRQQNLLPSFEYIVLQAMLDLLYKDHVDRKSYRTADLAFQIQDVCSDRDITDEALRSADVQKVGILLGRLGFQKTKSHGSQRRWDISKTEVFGKAKSAGITLEVPETEHVDLGEGIHEDAAEWVPDVDFWTNALAAKSKTTKLPW